MDSKFLKNLANGFLKETKDKLIQRGKETLEESINDFMDKGTDVVKEKIYSFTGQQEPKNESGEDLATKEVHNAEVVRASIFSGDEKYMDVDKFEKDLHSGLAGLVEGFASGNPAEAAMAVKELVTMAGEVGKFTEVQKTKRKAIEAERDIVVARINSQKEIILDYLERSFDERKENFAKLFTIVDDALAKDNMQQLAMGLDSINNLAASSPFKELANIESTQKAITNQNHIWDF